MPEAPPTPRRQHAGPVSDQTAGTHGIREHVVSHRQQSLPAIRGPGLQNQVGQSNRSPPSSHQERLWHFAAPQQPFKAACLLPPPGGSAGHPQKCELTRAAFIKYTPVCLFFLVLHLNHVNGSRFNQTDRHRHLSIYTESRHD